MDALIKLTWPQTVQCKDEHCQLLVFKDNRWHCSDLLAHSICFPEPSIKPISLFDSKPVTNPESVKHKQTTN